jgi:hypothetical protein
MTAVREFAPTADNGITTAELSEAMVLVKDIIVTNFIRFKLILI